MRWDPAPPVEMRVYINPTRELSNHRERGSVCRVPISSEKPTRYAECMQFFKGAAFVGALHGAAEPPPLAAIFLRWTAGIHQHGREFLLRRNPRRDSPPALTEIVVVDFRLGRRPVLICSPPPELVLHRPRGQWRKKPVLAYFSCKWLWLRCGQGVDGLRNRIRFHRLSLDSVEKSLVARR